MNSFHKLCHSGTPSEDSQAGWDLGNRMARGYWFETKWVSPMGRYAWVIQVFCSRSEGPPHFSNRTLEYRITSNGTDSFHIKLITLGHPIPKISTHLTIFWGATWMTEFVKTIHRQERTSAEKKSVGFHKKCSIRLWAILMFELLLCYHTAAWCMEQT